MSHEIDSDVGNLSDSERLQLLRARWPVFENEPEPAQGYDAFLVVLRHIYSFVPSDILPQYGEESLQVLQVARKPIHDSNAGLIKENKRSSLFELVDDPKEDLDRLRFESLAKNPKLVAKFWSRYYHLLYSSTVLALAPGSQEWVLDEPYEVQNIALESLFHWDGTRPLGESLGALFGVFRQPSTGWRYLRLPGMPTILRVLYKPNADQMISAPEFKDVRSFHLTAKDCEPTDGENKSFVLKEVKCQYRLIASVDLTIDTVRLYGINGAYIAAPQDHGQLVDTVGSIGDVGRQYMLFFARTAESAPPQVPQSREIVMPPITPEDDGGYDPYYPETNDMEIDNDNDDDAGNDGEAQPAKQPEISLEGNGLTFTFGAVSQPAPALDLEDNGPTFTFGAVPQAAPALDVEDDFLNSALAIVPMPTKSVANQYDDDSDDDVNPEPEPEPEHQDTEMAHVHPERFRQERSVTARPPSPSHDNRRDDRQTWQRPGSSPRGPPPRRSPSYERWPSPPRPQRPPYNGRWDAPPPRTRADRYRPGRYSRPVSDYRSERRDDFGPRPSGQYHRDDPYDDPYYQRDRDRDHDYYRERGPPLEYGEPRRRDPPRSSSERPRSRSPRR
ncbi:hypothetical protein PG984_007241 [Apiospora sp. TS-2023a]